MFSRPKILFLVSLLFVALLNSIPTYLLNFEFFYHSSLFAFYTFMILFQQAHKCYRRLRNNYACLQSLRVIPGDYDIPKVSGTMYN